MSLEILLNNRVNELGEIANALDIRTDKSNWKNTVLQFCMRFHDCLQGWSSNDAAKNNEIRACYNTMRQISRKKGVSEMLQLLYVINKIAEDYEIISKRE